MSTLYFREPGSRHEHIVNQEADTLVTMCGKPAKAGARYRDSERGADAKIRPVCPNCK